MTWQRFKFLLISRLSRHLAGCSGHAGRRSLCWILAVRGDPVTRSLSVHLCAEGNENLKRHLIQRPFRSKFAFDVLKRRINQCQSFLALITSRVRKASSHRHWPQSHNLEWLEISPQAYDRIALARSIQEYPQGCF
jgi:hypothetical protein